MIFLCCEKTQTSKQCYKKHHLLSDALGTSGNSIKTGINLDVVQWK